MGQFLPARLTRQPQQQPQIDWSNSLARSLVVALVPGMPEAISGVLPVQSGAASLSVNQAGRTFTSPSTQIPGNFKYLVNIPSSFDCTLLRMHSCVTPNTPSVAVPSLELNSAEVVLACDTAGQSIFSSTGNASAIIAIAPAGAISVIAGVKVVNSQLSYFNGKLLDTVVTGNRAIGAITQVSVGRASGNNVENIKYDLVLYWTRALSNIEIAQVSANPWQIFKNPQRRLLVEASGTGPVNATGTLASTLGDATLAASGAVLNAGTFTSTLANATMAASGAVGSAPSGVFASALADATMSAAGAATNAGSFATSLAGASMSAAGIVINRGTFSATMGDATMAAAGTVAPNATGTFSITLDGASMTAYGYNGVPPVLAGFFHRLPKTPRHVQRIP